MIIFKKLCIDSTGHRIQLILAGLAEIRTHKVSIYTHALPGLLEENTR